MTRRGSRLTPRRNGSDTRPRYGPEAANIAVVRRVIDEIWNAGDLDLADRLFAPSYVNHAGIIPDLVRGAEAIKISVALYRLAFPEFHVTMDELIGDADTVELCWTARKTQPREHSSPITGQQTGALTGTTLIRLAGGRIVESWTRWDMAGVLGRLGIVPAPGPATN